MWFQHSRTNSIKAGSFCRNFSAGVRFSPVYTSAHSAVAENERLGTLRSPPGLCPVSSVLDMKDDKKPPPSPDDATLVPENMRPVSGTHRDAAATLTPVPESKAFPAQTISGETIAPEAVAAKRAPM